MRFEACDYKGALEDFSRVIDLEPDDAFAYIRRAAVREKYGELREALEDYTKAIGLRPREAAAYYSRGKVRLRLKMDEEGCEDIRKAGSLGWKAASDGMSACHD